MAVPPYDSLETIVTAARIRLNDAIESAGGDVLTDTQPFTIQTINNAYRKMQDYFAANSAARLINEVTITALAVVGSTDAGILTFLNWTGYTDAGGTQHTGTLLPQDMIFPLRLWERVTGGSPAPPFVPMEYVLDGIPELAKQARNYCWEWREDAIYMPGSTSSMDLRIRYAAFLPDFVPASTTAFSAQPVPILRCLDAFAWYIAYEMSGARGDIDSATLLKNAEDAAQKWIGQEQRRAALRSQWTIPDIPAAAGNTQLDSVSTMLNTVRARLNAVMAKAGDVVVASQSLTQQCVNTAWRRLQQDLAQSDFSALTTEIILTAVPATATTDPGIFNFLNWAGYNDGSVNHAGSALPALLVRPLRLWERVTGSGAVFTPMETNVNGIGDQPKGARNYSWEWINNQINLPGSTSSMDIRIRYIQAFADFVNGSTPWYLQNIPITRALDALAWYTAFELVTARPDLGLTPDQVKAIADAGEEAANLLVAHDQKANEKRGEWTIPDIPAATGATNYDVVATVLNTVRTRLNAIRKASGDTLTASQSFAQQCFNTGWRKLQEALADKNYSTLIFETILTAVPVSATSDVGIMNTLSWTGYNDGSANHGTVVLPQTLIRPLKLWERVTGNASLQFTPMEYVQQGIGNEPKQARNYTWEWISDTIRLPGSTSSMDLRIRYVGFLADFTTGSSTPWYEQTVPIARCLDALAWYVSAEVAMARPDLQIAPQPMLDRAQVAAMLLVDKDAAAGDERAQWVIPDIPPSGGVQHYDNASVILNAARVKLNARSKLAGDIISAANPFTLQYFNMAYRRLQSFLANLGYVRFTGETILTAIPVLPSTVVDPAANQTLSWSGFFDGMNTTGSPALPDTLIFPLKIWERQTGVNALFTEPAMENMLDGLVTAPKMSYNGQWTWYNDTIYLPGSTFSMDFRIRYASYLPDLGNSGSTPWYLTQVTIARCLEPLSLYICAEVATARPDLGLNPMDYLTQAEAQATLIFNRDVRAKQRVNARRKSYSGRLESNIGVSDYGCY